MLSKDSFAEYENSLFENEQNYDGSGQVHTVRSEYNFGQYNIYLDGVFYASADDRLELDDAIRSLVAYKGFTVKRPKQKKTSPIRLTPDGNA